MSEKAIELIGNKPPIHSKLRPYYNDSKLKAMTKLSPYEPVNKLLFESPLLIPL